MVNWPYQNFEKNDMNYFNSKQKKLHLLSPDSGIWTALQMCYAIDGPSS